MHTAIIIADAIRDEEYVGLSAPTADVDGDEITVTWRGGSTYRIRYDGSYWTADRTRKGRRDGTAHAGMRRAFESLGLRLG